MAGAATARFAHSPKHALLAAHGECRPIAPLPFDSAAPAARVHVSTNARSARGCEAQSGSRLPQSKGWRRARRENFCEESGHNFPRFPKVILESR